MGKQAQTIELSTELGINYIPCCSIVLMCYNSHIRTTKCVKMRYTKGFTYMNKPYGWEKKQLYRLPFKHPKINRWYNILKVAKWEVGGKHIGFILGNHKKSFKQLEEMTTDIGVEIKESDCKDVPF